MGVTIQAESHRNELAGVYEKEHDPHTLEYYDQPPPIKLVYPAKNGRQVGVLHTPDYFVIRLDAVGWEEWKEEAQLARLLERMPNRYVRGDHGRWQCPPGERYAERLGFFYRVRSSAEIDWMYQRNLLFLEDYLRADCPAVGQATLDRLLALVASQPGMRLDDLLVQATGIGSDAVYSLIATQQLYVDLHAAALAEPDRVRVFRDQAAAHAGSRLSPAAASSSADPPRTIALTAGSPIVWDGRRWTILHLGETALALLAEDGNLVELPSAAFELLLQQGRLTGVPQPGQSGFPAEIQDRLAQAAPDDLREANRRYALLAARLNATGPASSTVPARTLRRWQARWREAEQLYHCGYLGLLPAWGRRGNRRPKLPDPVLQLLDQFIREDYETLKQPPRAEVYGALVRACEAKGLVAPSYKTFSLAIQRRPRQEQVEKRQGRRAAYQVAPFYWELTPTTPRHGDRPWEIAHIDHTQLDLELVCSRTGRPLGRPWATFLVDAYARRLLAVCLSFDRPSYRAGMMVLRECVRRHQRLPQTLVVDGGLEFAGVYFETLLARYECAKKTRPGAQPRFGSVCERLFGTTNTRFVHNLVGNTQIRENLRQVTRAVDPKQLACWTFGRLSTRLCEWAYEVYDTLDHPALGQSPREAFAAGLVQSGGRAHRMIPYDEDFRLATLPTTAKGSAQLQPRLGVKIHHLYYWSESFLDPALEKTQLPVRFDPWDAGVAYVFVKGRWVRCISEHYARFAGRSEREIQLATSELRRRQQRHAGRFTPTARQLADFLASLEAEEALLEQRLRDAEAKDVLMALEGRSAAAGDPTPATSAPVEPPSGRETGGSGPGQADPAPALSLYEDY
jgi:transposase InsO family protein